MSAAAFMCITMSSSSSLYYSADLLDRLGTPFPHANTSMHVTMKTVRYDLFSYDSTP
uniref:Uncharacterized protein n=1 Tax=Arundo donax TaxID=35708 RepID=A0A0A9AWK7_ARUDO